MGFLYKYYEMMIARADTEYESVGGSIAWEVQEIAIQVNIVRDQ